MIDFDTIRFISFLNDLAEKSKSEMIPFSRIKSSDEVRTCIVYDDNREESEDDCKLYPVVMDACINSDHHDIVAYYNDTYFEDSITVKVVETINDEPVEKYVMVEYNDGEIAIIIEDGRWYIA